VSRGASTRSHYTIPVEDKPTDSTIHGKWKIKEQDKSRVVLEPIYHDEDGKYKAQPLELYTSRLSLSYNKRRLDALDTVSTSYRGNIGCPMTNRPSTSFKPLTPPVDKSTGWRVWSRVETQRVANPSQGHETFDRTYSRSYQRAYSRPYNTDPVIPVASYSSGFTSSNKERYSLAGTYQEKPRRPNRDYTSKLGGSYQVKSFNRGVTASGHSY